MGICLIWKYNLNKWICLGLICLYLSHNLLIHFLTFFSLSHRWTKFRTAKPKSEKYVKYIKNSKLIHLFLSCSHIREYNYISFDISFWILFFFTFDFVQRQPPMCTEWMRLCVYLCVSVYVCVLFCVLLFVC